MWHQVGFMADAFAVFKEHGMSVDLVSTSETNVTVSLDPAANTLDGELLGKLQRDLSKLCGVQVIGPCASVSLVGRNIRAILHKLGDAFALFEEQKVYLRQPGRQRPQLHLRGGREPGRPAGRAVARPADPAAARRSGHGSDLGAVVRQARGRRRARAALVGGEARDIAGRAGEARQRLCLRSRAGGRGRARPSPASSPSAARCSRSRPIRIRTSCARSRPRGWASIACRWPRSSTCSSPCPGFSPDRILFTPNFAPRAEYERALALGVHVTIDNLFVLQHWLDAFKGKSVFLRIDTGIGRGHHHHVKTAGAQSKFGIPVEELDEVARLAKAGGVTINGLHAHAGSGVFDVENWTQVGSVLVGLVKRFPDVKYIDVGGGLGVPDRVEGRELDLARLDAALAKVTSAMPGVTLWLEPGRYLVANAGVLLARVTQTKVKSGIRYVGVATGMNSLIRPALYGAHHDIVNLTRYGEPANISANVVGPICESSDFLGHDRLLPECQSGDVLLIATAGAYGHAMSSNYNLRAPAEELLLK